MKLIKFKDPLGVGIDNRLKNGRRGLAGVVEVYSAFYPPFIKGTATSE